MTDLVSTPTFEQATPLRGYARMKQLWQKQIDEANNAKIRTDAENFELRMRLEEANRTIGEMLKLNGLRHEAAQVEPEVPEGYVRVRYSKALGLMIGDTKVEFAQMRLSSSRKSWGFLNSQNQPIVYVDKVNQRGLVQEKNVDWMIHQFA